MRKLETRKPEIYQLDKDDQDFVGRDRFGDTIVGIGAIVIMALLLVFLL